MIPDLLLGCVPVQEKETVQTLILREGRSDLNCMALQLHQQFSEACPNGFIHLHDVSGSSFIYVYQCIASMNQALQGKCD